MYQKGLGVAVRVALLLSVLTLNATAALDLRLADAAMRSDGQTVRSLLQQKVDVNAAQPDGMTALHWAVRHNDADTVQLLIRSGAKIDASTRYGVTPIYLASVNG